MTADFSAGEETPGGQEGQGMAALSTVGSNSARRGALFSP